MLYTDSSSKNYRTFLRKLKRKMYIRKNILLMAMMFVGNSVLSQTQTEIPKDSLPVPIREHLHKKYSNFSVVSVVKITDQSGIRAYKLEAHKKINKNRKTINHIYYLTYNVKGKLMLRLKDKKIYYSDSPLSKKQFSFGDDRHRDSYLKEK